MSSPELSWDGKYDKAGKKVAPVRLPLPFQTIETINESSTERQRTLDMFAAGRDSGWRNRLIWGDKKYVLPALLPEFQGKVDLIYIDPPFATGADFSMQIQFGDGEFTKEPSVIEQKAYRDTWGRGLDSYLQWFYDTSVLLRELLADTGSIYVHLDWHVSHYAKVVLDEVFGRENFLNEVHWYYYNKMHDSRKKLFPRTTDTILLYVKNEDANYTFQQLREQRAEPVRQLVRKKVGGQMINARDAEGRVQYTVKEDRTVDNVWRISMLQPADRTENLRYPTQKPAELLRRVIEASSREGDLVLDCFSGSGTTAATAEKLGRRWIAADLSRFAVHTTRKRLLSVTGVTPFVVQNLGKYERQAWQDEEFGENDELRQRAYREFILKLYGGTAISGYVWLHGTRAGRAIHVGAVDAPVSPGDVRQMVAELQRLTKEGGPSPVRNLDVLGWDFAFELNEVAKQQASSANISMRFFKIPLDVMDNRAVEQGDVKFFELAALAAKITKRGREVHVALTDFVIPVDDVPEDIQRAVKDWSHWIDYWAIDWDNRSDTFHNEWQTYRTKDKPKLERSAARVYEAAGRYRIVVKVIDILGNDTTKIIDVEVK